MVAVTRGPDPTWDAFLVRYEAMYVIALSIMSLSAGSAIKGGATGYFSSLMFTGGRSSFTDRPSKGVILVSGSLVAH